MMTYSFYLIALLVAIVTALTLPKLIRMAEKNVEDSYHEILNDPICIEKTWLLSILIIALPCSIFFVATENAPKSLCILFLGVIGYIDLKRNWVPDFLIYTFTFFSLFYLMDDITHNKETINIIINIITFIFPLIVFNLLGLFTSTKTFIASGDFYIVIPLALWIGDTTLILVSSVSILTAVIIGLISKKESLPFTPIIFFYSFIDILLNQIL